MTDNKDSEPVRVRRIDDSVREAIQREPTPIIASRGADGRVLRQKGCNSFELREEPVRQRGAALLSVKAGSFCDVICRIAM